MESLMHKSMCAVLCNDIHTLTPKWENLWFWQGIYHRDDQVYTAASMYNVSNRLLVFKKLHSYSRPTKNIPVVDKIHYSCGILMSRFASPSTSLSTAATGHLWLNEIQRPDALLISEFITEDKEPLGLSHTPIHHQHHTRVSTGCTQDSSAEAVPLHIMNPSRNNQSSQQSFSSHLHVHVIHTDNSPMCSFRPCEGWRESNLMRQGCSLKRTIVTPIA